MEELEPSIRYCLHKIGESNIHTSELMHIGEMASREKITICLWYQMPNINKLSQNAACVSKNSTEATCYFLSNNLLNLAKECERQVENVLLCYDSKS